ncbi:MAG: methyltransferase domain-containing protein [Polyangiaceae bacterium]
MTFDRRLDQSELMDTEEVPFEEFRACLVDLTRVNHLTLAYRPTLAFFEKIRVKARALDRPLEVVDVGSGYGDMLRAVAVWAKECGVPVSLTGVDMNPWSAKAATEPTPNGLPIRWVTADAFAYEPLAGIDVVISSLFTHHLPDPLVVKFLRFMEQTARVGWFVNDLHRHPLPYYFFRSFAKLARFHRFVQNDGPVSIARAFSPADWLRLLAEAEVDLAEVDIRWRVPFRLTVERIKQP